MYTVYFDDWFYFYYPTLKQKFRSTYNSRQKVLDSIVAGKNNIQNKTSTLIFKSGSYIFLSIVTPHSITFTGLGLSCSFRINIFVTIIILKKQS